VDTAPSLSRRRAWCQALLLRKGPGDKVKYGTKMQDKMGVVINLTFKELLILY
jgi:hypothetical protein